MKYAARSPGQRQRRWWSTPSIVLSGLALFVVLGGSAVAATGLINANDLAPGAVTSRAIRSGAVEPKDLSPSTRALLAGAQGVNGVKGETGTPGSAGSNGANGPNGANGANGAEGAKGTNGANGRMVQTAPTGPTESTAPTESMGPTGPKARTGPTGRMAPTGRFRLLRPNRA